MARSHEFSHRRFEKIQLPAALPHIMCHGRRIHYYTAGMSSDFRMWTKVSN
jgi:hypothetical protein